MTPARSVARSSRFHRVALLTLLALVPLSARAQLQWSVFDETASRPVPAAAGGGFVVTVPAGARYTFVATNFVPVDFTPTTAATVTVTATFKASGGLSSLSAGTRALGLGFYNHNNTTPGTTFIDDNGYFTWLNGRATGSLIELRRRNGNGPSPSLLNPTGTSFNTLGTGTATQTVGALSDGVSYSLTLRLVRSANGISLGTTSANTANAGVVILGDGLSQTAFTNPDNPPATTVFNEVGFMFLNSTTGDVTFTLESLTGLTPINPPAIAVAPASISVNPGQAGTLTVSATGTAPLSYQWRKDGTNLAGATAATLNFASAQAADAGSYTVVVTNAYGTVTSPAATVTVTTSPIPATLTAQPASIAVNAGQGATFSVAAFGSSPLAYQWRKDGTAITGATTNTFTLAAVQPADAGAYTVVVSNAAASVTSSAATLAVNTAPVITTQPVGVTAAVGQRATFTVAATGSPAPTYQWQRDGANLAGATNASYTIDSVAIAHAGVYTVRVLNAVSAVVSNGALLAIPSAMARTAVWPASAATGVNTDTPLRITFDRAPVIGTSGRIRIHRASDDAVVDTLDLGARPYTRTIGTQTVNYIFYPIIVTGNTAALYPHAGVLAYGQTYYITMEIGVINDSTGASFTGLSDPGAWRFTTKSAGPAAGATSVTVAADGSGDFTTVQGAIDFVPLNNTQRVVINVKKGLYHEMNYIGAQKPFITVRGEDRALTEIAYPNNNNFNSLSGNNRAMFSCDASDFTLETITLRNTTPAGGSQAEAYRGNGLRHLLNRVNLISLQDTFLVNGANCTAFVTDSYIEGDVDFMWGSGAVFMQRTELKATRAGFYTQVRNGATQFGHVYVDCKLTGADGLTNVFLGRVDPNPGNFPYSQCIWIDCAMGPHIVPEGWRLDNATTGPNIQYWEYRSTDLDGALLDVSRRHPSSRQLSEAEAALWRNPAYVLRGWIPEIAPTIETPPAPQTVTAGAVARLTVLANGSPAPALQWFKNGAAIPGATSATLLIPNVQSSDAGSYTVSAASVLGSVTSRAGTLAVQRGPFAGTYFGTLGGSTTGTFALYVRDNGTAVFLAQSATAAFVSRRVTVDASGRFQFAPQAPGAATVQVIAEGTLDATSGALSGTWGGVTLAGTRSAANGASQAFAGYFQTGVNGGSGTVELIVGSAGQAFAFTQVGVTADGGAGTVSATGAITIRTSGGANVTGSIGAGASSAALTFAPASGASSSLSGVGDIAASSQRLSQFSSRARVDAANLVVAGFVVAGAAPNDVLIRAVGPTLNNAFGVTDALTNPRLDLYRGSTLIASNTSWMTGLNPTGAALAAAQSGAFPLRATLADSALRLTLAPGAYTAIMSGATGNTAGSALLEVYDLSNGGAGQRLANFSSRAFAGTGANTFIAGLALSGAQTKRVLLRGAGPALTALGVGGALPRPVLALYRGTTLVAQNTGWSTSPDAAAITAAALEVAAFPFAANSSDSALLLSLSPGLYTVQISSPDATSGTALMEIYELP